MDPIRPRAAGRPKTARRGPRFDARTAVFHTTDMAASGNSIGARRVVDARNSAFTGAYEKKNWAPGQWERTDIRHRRRSPWRLVCCAVVVCGLIGWTSGCEEEVTLPRDTPATRPARPPAVDVVHTLHVKADRAYTIPNMVLVVRPNPAANEMAVTLMTATRGIEGFNVLFGDFVPGATLDQLPGAEITFIGGKQWLAVGNGIQTAFADYRPRYVKMKIERAAEGEASGTLEGEFYRFAKPVNPLTRPTELVIEATFRANLIVR